MADLSTISAVKAYLAINTAGQDALIAALISRESKVVENWTQRRFPSVVNTARRLNGTGTAMLVLPDSPVLGVTLVQINTVAVPLSTDGVKTGYVFDDTAVYLTDDTFPQGRQNVVCTWTAGFQESETDAIPAGNVPTIAPRTGGRAVTNLTVTNASTGAALTLVASAPVTGQYTFAAGSYGFAAADVGVSVTMTYLYVPGPVEQAVIEMVGLDLKARDNLGINSKSLAGETISYSGGGMTASVKEMLQPYRRMVPA